MIKRGDLRFRIILITGVIVFSIFYVFYPQLAKNINLGLDLKGGMYVLLRADTSSVPKGKESDAIGGAIEKIRKGRTVREMGITKID